MTKPDVAARKAELANNPKSAQIVVSSEDDKFLNKSLNITDENGEVDAETGEFVETEKEVLEEGVTEEEIATLEEKIGRKLTDEEVAELSAIKKEGEISEISVSDEIEFVRPEDLPPELEPHYKRMFASFTKKMQGISELRRKSELFDYLTENPQMARRMLTTGEVPAATVKGGAEETDTGDAADSFVKQLNLPEDNELTPAINALAKLMVKGFGEIKTGREQDSQTKLKDGIKTYFDQNPTLMKDQELCVTMDRIGMESPRLYLNMPRLRKFAEAELGRPAKVAKEEAKTTLAKLYKSMKEAKKSAVSKPSISTERGQTAKPKNIEESFNRALTKVRLKYGNK